MEGASRDEIFLQAEEAAYSIAKSGKLLTMIGGDHSTTIPVLKGIDRALEKPFGIIHIDAHFDLCHEMGEIYSRMVLPEGVLWSWKMCRIRRVSSLWESVLSSQRSWRLFRIMT